MAAALAAAPAVMPIAVPAATPIADAAVETTGVPGFEASVYASERTEADGDFNGCGGASGVRL